VANKTVDVRFAMVESLEGRQLLSTTLHAPKGTVVVGFSTKQLVAQTHTYVTKQTVTAGKYIKDVHGPAPVFQHLTLDTSFGLGGGAIQSVPPGTIGQFHINLIEGPNLQLPENAEAKAAFEAAAAYIESQFTDPVTINVDVDFAPITDKNVLGETSINHALFAPSAYDDIVARLRAEGTSAESVAGQLPEHFSDFRAILPATDGSGAFFLGGMQVSTANLLALGVPDTDPTIVQSRKVSKYDPTQLADANIKFNSLDAALFDFTPTDSDTTDDGQFFDPTPAIEYGQIDFRGVAIHELTHALGFESAVDDVDFALVDASQSRAVLPTVQDLFRIKPEDGLNFANAPRVLATGINVRNQVLFTDGSFDPTDFAESTTIRGEIPMSTGSITGDGNQASHWKDDVLTSFNQLFNGGTFSFNNDLTIGIMDPTASTPNGFGSGSPLLYSLADLRAMDITGYDLPAPDGGLYTFSQNPIGVTEGSGGVKVTINRVGDPTGVQRIEYRTQDFDLAANPNAAVDGTDYTGVAGDLIFGDGQTSADIFIPILDNNIPQSNRTFDLIITPFTTETIADAAGDGSGHATVTIQDDDSAFQFSNANFYARERDGQAVITVQRIGSILAAANVDVSTSDGTATAVDDYTPITDTLHFDVGEREKSFIIAIKNDALTSEGTETVNVALSNPTDGALLGNQSTTTLNIQESSAPTVTDVHTNSANGKRIESVTVTFSQSLASAPPLSSLALFQRSNEGSFGSGSRKAIQIKSTSYDPATRSFTMVPAKPLKVGTTYQLNVEPTGVNDANGNVLDGNNDGVPGDRYSVLITRATKKLNFFDRIGQAISLTLNIGTMEVVRRADGSILSLRLTNTLAGASQLRGVISPQTGSTIIDQIIGSAGVDLALPSPQFVINQIV